MTTQSNTLTEIFQKRPLLKGLIEEHGQKNLKEFSRANLQALHSPKNDRAEEFLNTLQTLVEERLGTELADKLKEQVSQYYCASTADHHGPINSSLAISSNLILAAGYSEMMDPILKYILVFSCASVSLNNEDYPRGLLFHALKENGYKEDRFSILPSNSHSSVVYNFRPYKEDEVKKIEGVLREKTREGTFSPEQALRVAELFNSVLKNTNILNAKNLCEQFTKLNFQLWRELFKGNPNFKDLVYVELEELAIRLLLKHHLEQDTVIHRLIFDSKYESSLLKPLQEAMETYLRQGALGTHLFWWITPDKNYRIKLIRDGQKLRTEDGSFEVELTPSGLAQAFAAKQLMPNLLIIYTLVHLYYGFNCLGGFNQIHYLDSMQNVYIQSQLDPSATQANSRLYNYGLNLAFLKDEQTPANGLDLFLYEDDPWGEIQKKIAQTSLTKAFENNWSTIHKILYPEKNTL